MAVELLFYATNFEMTSYVTTATGIKDLNQFHPVALIRNILTLHEKAAVVRLDKL